MFDGIVFGPLGPVQHLAYVDARVRVDVAYRTATDRRDGSGEDALGPSIAAGSVSYVIAGTRHTVDLAAVFPIHEHHIELAAEPSCGTRRALTRHGSYLAIEAVLGEKGCAAIVGLIDLYRGTVVERVAFDDASAHRFDAEPASLAGESLRVEHVQIIDVGGATDQRPNSWRPVPWWVVAVRAVDARGRARELTYCAADDCRAGGRMPPADRVPRAGSRVFVGSLRGGVSKVTHTMLGEPIVRLMPGRTPEH